MKYPPEHYHDFNILVQKLFRYRLLSANEYHCCFDLIENYHIEHEALIMIIKYCINKNNEKIHFNYIATVAKNWASKGITTANAVEVKLLNEQNRNIN